MNASALRSLMSEAHRCAMAMLSNAEFVGKELPNVRMDEATRTRTRELCERLVGTKHDIVSELGELDDLLEESAGEDRIKRKVAMMLKWLGEDVELLHGLVTALEAAAKRDPDCTSAYILVSESAVNVIKPFRRAQAAAESIWSL